jgi:hypothetical protein
MNSKSLSILTNSVKIKDGEYLPAYMSRLIDFASFISSRDFYKIFGLTVPRVGEGYLPLWAIKIAESEMLEKPFWETIDEHLGGRYWRPFVPENELAKHIRIQGKSNGTGRVIFRGEKQLSRFSPLKYCARCRDEETMKYGFPIWKSRNQFATVFTCDVHGDILHQKYSVTSAAPDGGTIKAFEQAEGTQPEISNLHRWFEFESDTLKVTECSNGNGLIPVYRSVFLESSFYQGRATKTDRHLNHQWMQAAKSHLGTLYPQKQKELYQQLCSEGIQLSVVMNTNKPLHPLIMLMFRTFYMFQFRA